MRLLVLSDVHANAFALRAVLDEAAAAGPFERTLVLGDVVGYGCHPEEVVGLLRALPGAAFVRGNHDKVVAGLEDGGNFNLAARRAADWTRATLRPETLEWLSNLPAGPVVLGDVVLAHGSPADEDAYVFSEAEAASAAAAALASGRTARFLLVGHTHVAAAIRVSPGPPEGRLAPRAATVALGPPPSAWLLNPGSVGQPRDGNPAAAWGILDLEAGRFEFRRTPYDVRLMQRALAEAGLPRSLADRLAVGA